MDERIREKLKTEMSEHEEDLARRKKEHNIKAFSELSRFGLSHSRLERKLLLWTTPDKEKIYIQYPGKESARWGNKQRPWDFRPKLVFDDGRQYHDISFGEVWEDIKELREKDPDMLPYFTTILYRLSVLTDHKLIRERCEYVDIDPSNGEIKDRGTLDLEHYKYSPDREVMDRLNERIGKMGGVSFEAYLVLTDYIAQNEDCKYYYRDTVCYNGTWDGMVGRSNNLLTHIMIAALLDGKVTPTERTDNLNGRQDVAPIGKDKLHDVSDGLIYEGTFKVER